MRMRDTYNSCAASPFLSLLLFEISCKRFILLIGRQKQVQITEHKHNDKPKVDDINYLFRFFFCFVCFSVILLNERTYVRQNIFLFLCILRWITCPFVDRNLYLSAPHRKCGQTTCHVGWAFATPVHFS